MNFKYILSVVLFGLLIACDPDDPVEETNLTQEPDLIAFDTLYLQHIKVDDLFAGGPGYRHFLDETNTDTIYTYEGFIYFVDQDFLGEIIEEKNILGEVISRILQMPEVISFRNYPVPSEMEFDINITGDEITLSHETETLNWRIFYKDKF